MGGEGREGFANLTAPNSDLRSGRSTDGIQPKVGTKQGKLQPAVRRLSARLSDTFGSTLGLTKSKRSKNKGKGCGFKEMFVNLHPEYGEGLKKAIRRKRLILITNRNL